jgi:SAM-dependent methyltransferase
MTGVAHYGADLARIHHAHFGHVARAAADELVARLAAAGLAAGTVVDLAAGSGLFARRMTDAGYACVGVDISASMLALAREVAPAARFEHGSLWSFALPPCVAVAAIGEALCYATDPAAGLDALAARFRDVYAALAPGGLLVFDVSGPGRSGPSGVRHVTWERDGDRIEVVEREEGGALTRDIQITPRSGEPTHERHVLRTYSPASVMERLGEAGFRAEAPAGWGAQSLAPSWQAFVATK